MLNHHLFKNLIFMKLFHLFLYAYYKQLLYKYAMRFFRQKLLIFFRNFYYDLVRDNLQTRKRLCTPAQLRRASPTPIRWIA